jgi:hypothetical protein
VLLARLMSGYGRDASLNARERKAPGSASITALPGSPTASRSSNFGSEAVDGKQRLAGDTAAAASGAVTTVCIMASFGSSRPAWPSAREQDNGSGCWHVFNPNCRTLGGGLCC